MSFGNQNTCPCGTNGGAPVAPSQRPPPQQPGCQQYQPQRPQVECNCTQNRQRANLYPQPPPPIQADIVTCSRPRQQPQQQPVIPESPQCNCRGNVREQVVQKSCTCAPLQPPPPVPQVHTTHVHMPCPQNTSRGGPVPYQRPVKACDHCRNQRKKKKCVIQ